jgi:hypothetical protein
VPITTNVVSLNPGSLATQSAASLHMVKNSRQQIHSLLQRFPLTNKERQELLPKTEKGSANEGINLFKYARGRLSSEDFTLQVERNLSKPNPE